MPLASVQSKNKKRSVTLASGEERPIKTGATDGAQMIVVDGLSEGDTILASAPVSRGQGAGAGPVAAEERRELDARHERHGMGIALGEALK